MGLHLIRQYDLDRLTARREKALAEIAARHEKEDIHLCPAVDSHVLRTDEILERSDPSYLLGRK